ncbi:hypothetical protein KC19_7G004500 [Ceratodon purpureus]|uniref:Uncharacterized protein n=1 Tax=Ceratodon purpureus TaxID=3225 RepID=A0A8T0H376_CERPU|nr:hypothetical protein KC19_7G004500 [Ceratodon purpureus]
MECNFRFECRVWHFPISSYPVPFTSLFKPIPTTFSASNCGYDYDRLKMTFALRSRGLFVKQSTCKLWKLVNCDEDSWGKEIHCHCARRKSVVGVMLCLSRLY